MIVIILFYILEPLGNAIMGPEIEMQVAVFASGRLIAMAIMLGMANFLGCNSTSVGQEHDDESRC